MSAHAPLSPRLRELAEQRHGRIVEAAGGAGIDIPALDALPGDAARVLACSEFVAQAFAREPELLSAMLADDAFQEAYSPARYVDLVAGAIAEVKDETALIAALRRLRRREMLRIAWRDIGGLGGLEQTVADASGFADAAVDAALSRLDAWQREQMGVPTSHGGASQSMVVLAMGKLGAEELNFSSDIDLIFAFPENGETVGGRRSRSNEEYFVRLSQRLIHVLSATTEHGQVFRVDMRLRPFGASGPLAMSFNAMEQYYLAHGRDWERYALIRARPMAGDRDSGDELLERLRPFVYRRYIDFGALEALREMKALVAQEVVRKGMEDNVKLGPGGIREIEFIGQAFQMVRGGRVSALRDRHILPVLRLLGESGLLPDYGVMELSDAYRFLRDTEHRLQEAEDKQTHNLPDSDRGREALAAAMGFATWGEFARVLDQHRARVQSHFDQIFVAPQAEPGAGDKGLAALWEGLVEDPGAIELLSRTGFTDAATAWEQVRTLRDSQRVRGMGKTGRERLQRFMPLLLGAVAGSSEPDMTLRRVLDVVESIARRSVYLALLIERPLALSQLVRLCSASPWITHLIAQYPVLLDELLDPRTLYAPQQGPELVEDLRERIAGVDEGDGEQEMERLRQFKQSATLRVAAADVSKAMRLMVVSDHLTEIAEVILRQVLAIAWRDRTARYGIPRCVVDGDEREAGFAIVAYGKCGGIELGYGSDLDLVFLHGSRGENQHTDGERAIENSVFFGRLAQRIVHVLTARTAGGVLYEVDARLRPSGASGLMVSSMPAFEQYQTEEAWTWEHQALVRARVVAGDPDIAEEFAAIRREVLLRERDPEALRAEVRDMRRRMREQLVAPGTDRFDLKQGTGGIADVEFMVQYGTLRWASRLGSYLQYTDNIRLLEGFAHAGLMPERDTELLSNAYRAYRARVHELALQEQPAVVSDEEFRDYRDGVARIWSGLMESSGP